MDHTEFPLAASQVPPPPVALAMHAGTLVAGVAAYMIVVIDVKKMKRVSTQVVAAARWRCRRWCWHRVLGGPVG
jgi:hypothetical protein